MKKIDLEKDLILKISSPSLFGPIESAQPLPPFFFPHWPTTAPARTGPHRAQPSVAPRPTAPLARPASRALTRSTSRPSALSLSLRTVPTRQRLLPSFLSSSPSFLSFPPAFSFLRPPMAWPCTESHSHRPHMAGDQPRLLPLPIPTRHLAYKTLS